VDIIGTLDTIGGQRVLIADVVTQRGPVQKIKPYFIGLKGIGGSAPHANIPSIIGGTGAYNVGMPVKAAGSMNHADAELNGRGRMTSPVLLSALSYSWIISTFARGTITVSPLLSLASSIRTTAPDST